MKKTMLQPNVILLESIDSTNNYARELFSKGKPEEGTVVLTRDQQSGKGLGSNSWESEPGKNLTFSVILYPDFLHVEEQILLNETIALAVADFIRSIDSSLNVKIKWPNDIYIYDKKVAGILIENTISGNNFKSSIVGIGVNINQTVFLSNAPNPTSLLSETGKELEIDKCFLVLFYCIAARYLSLCNNNTELISSDYLKHLYRINEFYNYRIDNKIVSAKLTGVSNFGRLILQFPEGHTSDFDLKEVEFIL